MKGAWPAAVTRRKLWALNPPTRAQKPHRFKKKKKRDVMLCPVLLDTVVGRIDIIIRQSQNYDSGNKHRNPVPLTKIFET